MTLFVANLIIAILLVFELIKWLWDNDENITKKFVLVILLVIGVMTLVDRLIIPQLKYILAH